MPYRLSGAARRALVEIRVRGVEEFGAEVADNYDPLIDTALRQIRDDPYLRGSAAIPRLARIGEPRHVIIYRLGDDGVVRDSSHISRNARRLARAQTRNQPG